ncbi:uncharacterized protein A4U43_C08F25110 [Asparagus officinalis]|nr:uncharacterized protein A4U43_C08F25110 [Asparagus officinalis]
MPEVSPSPSPSRKSWKPAPNPTAVELSSPSFSVKEVVEACSQPHGCRTLFSLAITKKKSLSYSISGTHTHGCVPLSSLPSISPSPSTPPRHAPTPSPVETSLSPAPSTDTYTITFS